MLTVRNKRVLLELLKSDTPVAKLTIAEGLDQDEHTKAILAAATQRRIPIEERPRNKMSMRRSGSTHEALAGHLELPAHTSLDERLAELYKARTDPFFLIVNRVKFPSNLGVIVRTAYAAGVNGLIFQGAPDAFINEDVLHYSMGTIARIPLVKTNIFEALKELRKNGIKTVCLDMDGETYYESDLSGPVAFILGAERAGSSDTLLKHCSQSIALPMQHEIDSLNVSASTSVVLYEKLRQDAMRST